MVHPKHRFIPVAHSYGVKELGHTQHCKGIGLPSFMEGIECDRTDEHSVKYSEQPAPMGKQPFIGVPGFFPHKRRRVILLNPQCKCRQRTRDQVHPQNMACLQRGLQGKKNCHEHGYDLTEVGGQQEQD